MSGVNFRVRPDLCTGETLEVTLDEPRDLLMLEILIATKQLRTEARRIADALEKHGPARQAQDRPAVAVTKGRRNDSSGNSGGARGGGRKDRGAHSVAGKPRELPDRGAAVQQDGKT